MKRCVLLMFLAVCLLATACSDFDESSATESSFPEEESVALSAGESSEAAESSLFEAESSAFEESSATEENSGIEESSKIAESSEIEENSEIEESSKPEEDEDSFFITESGLRVELLGNPYASEYKKFKKSDAHIPWDLIVFENKLFVGSGDYSANSGPVPMKYYDIESCAWVKNGSLPDEAVMRFLVIGGRLCATGTDPKQKWDKGNYYVFENGKWRTKRVIPASIHNYDLVEYNGMLFAAGGALDVNDMVTVSRDGGNTFEPVPFLCESEITDNIQKRVYNLFVLEGELYALFSDCSAYRYTETGFVFDNHWNGNASFHSKVMLGEEMYFASDYLFRISNVKKGEYIPLDEQLEVNDVFAADGAVYAAASKKNENGKFTVSVWRGVGNDFSKLFELEYPVGAFSLAVYQNAVYLGMGGYGNGKTFHENCGDILKVSLSQE